MVIVEMRQAKPQKMVDSMIVLALVFIVVQVGEAAEKGWKVSVCIEFLVAKICYYILNSEIGCVHVLKPSPWLGRP